MRRDLQEHNSEALGDPNSIYLLIQGPGKHFFPNSFGAKNRYSWVLVSGPLLTICDVALDKLLHLSKVRNLVVCVQMCVCVYPWGGQSTFTDMNIYIYTQSCATITTV